MIIVLTPTSVRDMIVLISTSDCSVHGESPDLRPQFKRRDSPRSCGRYVPQRLQLSGNSSGCQMAGYLRRRLPGERWRGSTALWFVLRDRVLYTYRAPEDAVATEALPVLGYTLDNEAR